MADDEHFYHTTEAENLEDIRSEGLTPHRPSHRGEQGAWPSPGPDGRNTEPRVYLAGSASQTTKFQASGRQALLRVKAELLKDHPVFSERYTGDYFTRKRIKPEHLEVQVSDGWEPLAQPANLKKALPPHIGVEEIYHQEFADPDFPGGGGAERSFRITHPKHPHSVRLDLIRSHKHPAGHWEVQDMFAETGEGIGEWAPQNANHIGPGDMRKIARHLRDEHGIRSLAGERVTGVRRGKVDQNRNVNVEIRKSHDPIVAPAIRLHTGAVYRAPEENGDEPIHGDAMWEALRQGAPKAHVEAAMRRPEGTGFVTRSGKYLSRRDAIPVVLRLQQLKESVSDKASKLLDQYESGKPDVSLDSYDINFAKAQPSFRIVDGDSDEGKPYSQFSLEVMHPNGKQGAVLHLGRESHYAPGHWHLFDVEPIDRTQSIKGAPFSRNFANRLGPSVMRATVRELRRQGVRSIHGFRVTGSRFPGHTDEGAVEGQHVDVTLKSLVPHIREMYNDVDRHFGNRFVGIEATHPETQHSVEVHFSSRPDQPGLWKIDDIVPSYHRVSSPHARKFANLLGPGMVRHIARHLKEKYGVEQVSGYRITGSRHQGSVAPESGIPVDVTLKSLEAPDLSRRGRGDALQPYAVKKRKNAKLGQVDLDIEITAPGPMRRKYNAPVSIVKSADAGTYIGRRVQNEDQLRMWFAQQPTIANIRLDDDPHVTVVYSPTGFPWTPDQNPVIAQVTGWQVLGKDRALVLNVHAPELHDRYQDAIEAGADPMYSRYKPHVTLGYLNPGQEPPMLKKPPFQIVLGPEETEPTTGNVFENVFQKAWTDAASPDGQPTEWKVKPFQSLYTMGKKSATQMAHIYAPGKKGAIMSFRHNAKTGHVEIMKFRAYEFAPAAFEAGSAAMQRGVRGADVDNTMEYHRSNVGVLGVGGVRAAAKYLRDVIGAKTVGGLRVSGSRMNNPNELPKTARPSRGGLEGLPGVKVKRDISKAIDYDALEEEHEPRAKKSGKGKKGSPVGSRTDQARHQRSAYDAAKARIEALKPKGVAEKEWTEGVKHEAEHKNVAPSKVDQAKIAAAHLKEEPRYYSKLNAAGIK